MESFIQQYFLSDNEDVNEEILERRISPYVTLRPGDLAALLKSELSTSHKHSGNHGTNYHNRKINAIFEKSPLGLSGDSDDEKNENNEIICRGADQGHVPVEYRVRGLKRHEMPVIGFFVDRRICPGFQYQVRKIDSKSPLWGDKVRTLESIGMGYGRRLTFSGDVLNSNDFYFWSDSEPNGFAFSIQAVEIGQKFIIQDSLDSQVGEAVIKKICAPQEEISMDAGENGVIKRVHVVIMCSMIYFQRHHHGLKDLVSSKNEEIITGEAILSKPRSARKASLAVIDRVFLPRVGHCKLIPDN